MQNNYQVNKILRIIAVIICSLFIFAKATSETLAKYTSSDSASDQAVIAKFIDIDNDLTISGSNVFDTNIIFKAGDTKTVYFTIKNTGETAVELKLNLTSTNNLPLTFKWNDIEDLSHLTNLNIGETKIITLTISWDEENNDYIYSDAIEHIVVQAICTQID